MIRVELTRKMLDNWPAVLKFLNRTCTTHQLEEGTLTGLGLMRGYVAVVFQTSTDELVFDMYVKSLP